MSPLVDILNSRIVSKYNDGTSYTQDTPIEIVKDYLDVILDYLQVNLKGIVSYSGIINTTTPPSPDPVTSDTINVSTTKTYSQYNPIYIEGDESGQSFDNWIRYILTNIYNNVFIDQGLYLARPLSKINFFNQSLLTTSIDRSIISSVYINDCDDNGRLRDDVDIAKDCQSALIDTLLNILRLSVNPIGYTVSNLTQTSSGLASILINQIE